MSAAKRTLALLLIVACAVLAGCAEGRARRLSRQADERAHENRYEEAIGLLERLQRDYPETEAARGVKERITLWRGLMEAGEKRDRRRAKDDLIAIARGLLHYHERHRRYPDRLDALVGEQVIPDVDPWGHVYIYAPSVDRTTYRLECLGEDGVKGGEGDSVDLRVVNGNLVQDLPWEDR